MSINDLITPVEGNVLITPTADAASFFKAEFSSEQMFNAQLAETNLQTASFAIQSKEGYQIQYPGKVRHGYDWMAIKQIMTQIIEDPKTLAQYPEIKNLQWDFDNDVKRNLKNIILDEETIPVRSGLLKDTMMATVHVVRHTWYNTHIVHAISYQTPLFYPYPIGGNVQHTMEEGKGPTYRPMIPIPNQHTLRNFEDGTSLYLLNDPRAEPDFVDFINPKLLAYYAEAFAFFFTNLDLAIYVWQEGLTP